MLLGPALKTWQKVPEQREKLAQDLAAVQALRGQVQALKNQPSLSFDAAYLALGKTTRSYLPANTSMNLLGDQVTVQLQAVPAHALAQWLAQARSNARATPLEARLTRSAAPAAAAPAGNAPVTLGSTPVAMPRWDGTVVLALPASPAR